MLIPIGVIWTIAVVFVVIILLANLIKFKLLKYFIQFVFGIGICMILVFIILARVI